MTQKGMGFCCLQQFLIFLFTVFQTQSLVKLCSVVSLSQHKQAPKNQTWHCPTRAKRIKVWYRFSDFIMFQYFYLKYYNSILEGISLTTTSTALFRVSQLLHWYALLGHITHHLKIIFLADTDDNRLESRQL